MASPTLGDLAKLVTIARPRRRERDAPCGAEHAPACDGAVPIKLLADGQLIYLQDFEVIRSQDVPCFRYGEERPDLHYERP